MTGLIAFTVALLVVVNVLNNRLLVRAYTLTCIVTAGILLAAGRLAGLSWAELGLSAGSLPRGLLWSAVLVAAVLVVYVLIAAHPRSRTALHDERAARHSGRSLAWQALVRVPFGTVLLEEVAFRSVLLAAVTHDHGVVWGVGTSSMLFGLWHILPSTVMTEANALSRSVLGTGRAALVRGAAASVVATAAAGIFLCWLRLASGSLLPPAGVHWAVNATGFVSGWVTARRFRRVTT